MNNIITYVKTHPLYFVFFSLLAVIVILIITVLVLDLLEEPQEAKITTTTVTPFPTDISANNFPQASRAPQRPTLPFAITETTPKNSQPVAPGQITLSFSTNSTVTSANQFSMEVFPPPATPLRFENSYPTKRVVTTLTTDKPVGTVYEVIVRNQQKQPVYAWEFVLTANPPANFNADEEYETGYFDPLFNHVPYSSTTFDLDYTELYTLTVKSKSADKKSVVQAVNTWLREKGADPNRYYIKYE